MKASDVKLYLTLALVAGGGYLLWKSYSTLSKAGSAVSDAAQSAGSSIADKLLSWTNPYDPSSDLYLRFKLMDGSTHAVQSSLVGPDGAFTFNGVNYVMKTDTAGNRVAIPA